MRVVIALSVLLAACGESASSSASADAASSADTSQGADIATPADTGASSDDLVDDAADAADDAADVAEAPDAGPFVLDETCDPTRPPIVMAHGFLASGDTWAPHAMRFIANGWCSRQLATFDWNTFDQDTTAAVTALDATIDAVRAANDDAQVVLVGHSAGGGLGYDYLADAGRAAKVARYVYVGSTLREVLPANGTPLLNLWSTDDAIIGSKGDIPGATNVQVSGDDHFGVATSEQSFEAMHQFITGEAPAVSALTPGEGPAWIAGRAVVFGDNAPAAGGTLTVWEVDAAGARQGGPIYTTTVAEDGWFGPLAARVGARYELALAGVGLATIHYFKEPLQRSNPFVYVRALPAPEAGLAGAILGGIPREAGKAVIVAFNASRGFLYGKDTLDLDTTALLTEANAAASKTLIALFLYDDDSTPETEGAAPVLFESFPFLGARDTTLTAGGAVTLRLGDRAIGVPRFDSSIDGVSVAIWD